LAAGLVIADSISWRSAAMAVLALRENDIESGSSLGGLLEASPNLTSGAGEVPRTENWM
jgi:hypothetical protein